MHRIGLTRKFAAVTPDLPPGTESPASGYFATGLPDIDQKWGLSARHLPMNFRTGDPFHSSLVITPYCIQSYALRIPSSPMTSRVTSAQNGESHV